MGFKAFSGIDGESLKFPFLLSFNFMLLLFHLLQLQNLSLVEFDLSLHWILNFPCLSDETVVNSASDWLNWLRLNIGATHLYIRLGLLRIGMWVDWSMVLVVDVLGLGLNLISGILHLSASSLPFSATKLEDNDSEDCSSSNHSDFEYLIVSLSLSSPLLLLLIGQITSVFIILKCLHFIIEGHGPLVLTALRVSGSIVMLFHVVSLTGCLIIFLNRGTDHHLIQLLLRKRSIDSLAFDFLGGG